MKQWRIARNADGDVGISNDMGLLGYADDIDHAHSIAARLVARYGGTILTEPDDTPRVWLRVCQCCGANQLTDEWNGGEPYAPGACPECPADRWGPWHDSDEPHPAVWA